MGRRYVTLDVFSAQVFGGNPLAVVLDADGLCAAQMQSIATEFNYSETTFVLPPRAAEHTAHVRIFTPRTEVPFAGHPNVGTAVALARELEAQGRGPGDRLVFEEAAGLVPLQLMRENGAVVGAELIAPQPLSLGSAITLAEAAACLSLTPADIRTAIHPPQVMSVGLAFLIVELTTRDVLRRAKPSLRDHERVLPPVGTDSVFAYVRGAAAADLQARMFSPLDGIVEDPATGSAAAATLAFLASTQREHDTDTDWRVEQGADMGRPSLIFGRTQTRGGRVTAVHVGGRAVPVMRGVLEIA